MKRFRGLFGLASLLVMVWFTTATTARGDQTFGYNSRKPERWETTGPILEEEPGNNLYWHDPLLGSWEKCRSWPPATNGCPPSWYGKVDMLALFRDQDDEYSFATLGPGRDIALGTSNFRSEFSSGVRALLGKTLGDWYRVEASYFGSHSWDDAVVIRDDSPNAEGGNGNLFSPFSNFGAGGGQVGVDYNNFVSLRFRSTLHNGEFNLRRRVLMRPGDYETSLLIGGRYMDIGEEFNYFSESTTPGPGTGSNAVAIATSNQMIGVQIGMLSQFLIQPRAWIDFEMKGGIFQNEAKLARSYAVDGAAVAMGHSDEDATAFVGDLSLQFNYQFAPRWTFYAGYNAMWVTGVALASENFQSDLSVLTLGPTEVSHTGEMVYHGPNIGLVLAY